MPDYIDKILKEKLPPSTQTYDQEYWVSLLAHVDSKFHLEVQHVPPTREQNDAGIVDIPTKITSFPD